MAGIVAAETDNGIGIAGVGYAGVSVMPVTVLGADGTGQDSDIIEGVVWAADHGADVILMAFSATGYSSALQAADRLRLGERRRPRRRRRQRRLVHARPSRPATAASSASRRPTRPTPWRSFSNYGESVVPRRAGRRSSRPTSAAGTASISGTSAVGRHGRRRRGAAPAPTIRAASNGVIVGRLARNADPAGTATRPATAASTWRAPWPMPRPMRSSPRARRRSATAGPFVGPYVAASNFADVTGTIRDSVTLQSHLGRDSRFSCTGCNGTGITSYMGGGAATNATGVYTVTGWQYSGNGPATITVTASARDTQPPRVRVARRHAPRPATAHRTRTINLTLTPIQNGLSINDVSRGRGHGRRDDDVHVHSDTGESRRDVDRRLHDGGRHRHRRRELHRRDRLRHRRRARLPSPRASRRRRSTVTVCRDATFEADETFTVTLSAPTNATITDGTGQGTIPNDDTAPTFSINDVTPAEGPAAARPHSRSRSPRPARPSSAPRSPSRPRRARQLRRELHRDRRLRDDLGHADLRGRRRPPRRSAVTVCRDATFEADETFNVNLSSPTNATIVDGSGLGTIQNDDTAPTFAINDVSATEGNGGGTTTLTFTVTKTGHDGSQLDGRLHDDARDCRRPAQHAQARIDYLIDLRHADIRGRCNDRRRSPSPSVATPSSKRTRRSRSTFQARPTPTITDGSGLGTIQNDDTAPTLSINDVSVAEGNGAGTTS